MTNHPFALISFKALTGLRGLREYFDDDATTAQFAGPPGSVSVKEDTMSTDRKKLALGYLEAVAGQQYDKVEGFLAPDLRFRGPARTRWSDRVAPRAAYLQSAPRQARNGNCLR